MPNEREIAEIEAVLLRHHEASYFSREGFKEAIPEAAREIAALRAKDREDGAREMQERAVECARGWMDFTGCRDGENTDGLDPQTRMYARGHYHARSAIAASIAALPLAPKEDGDA